MYFFLLFSFIKSPLACVCHLGDCLCYLYFSLSSPCCLFLFMIHLPPSFCSGPQHSHVVIGHFTAQVHTLSEEVSLLNPATHILLPSEAGPFPFLRCMMLKIAWLFPNMWAEDWAMFSSWEGWQQEKTRGRGTTLLTLQFLVWREWRLTSTRGQ